MVQPPRPHSVSLLQALARAESFTIKSSIHLCRRPREQGTAQSLKRGIGHPRCICTLAGNGIEEIIRTSDQFGAQMNRSGLSARVDWAVGSRLGSRYRSCPGAEQCPSLFRPGRKLLRVCLNVTRLLRGRSRGSEPTSRFGPQKNGTDKITRTAQNIAPSDS
jgi:hypothetical protein